MEKNGIDEDLTALIFLGTGCSLAVPDFRCLLQPSDPPCNIILTHEHADAILGLDDIRSFQPRGSAIDSSPLPVFLSQFTMESISTRFPYLVEKKVKQVPRRVSQLDWRIIEENCDKPFIASGLSFTPLPVMHGEDYVALGFLFGHKSKVAYISDVSRIPPSTEYAISKDGAGQLDLLILDTNLPLREDYNLHTSVFLRLLRS